MALDAMSKLKGEGKYVKDSGIQTGEKARYCKASGHKNRVIGDVGDNAHRTKGEKKRATSTKRNV